MNLRRSSPSKPAHGRTALRAQIVRVLLAGLLGVVAAVLVSCGSSSAKLIPAADAGPLQSDFEAVAQESEAGNGNCSATEAAIAKTEQDFGALPATIDAGLRATLRQGIANLREHALALCAQPLAQTSATSSTPKTTGTRTTPTTPTTTPTTPTTTPTAPTTTPTTPSPGGGTAAPGSGESSSGAPSGQGGGTGAGESAAGASGGGSTGGAGAGAQEVAK